MQISTGVNYAGDIVKAADTVAKLESAGIDTVWIAEAYSFDAVSLMGYLAAKTEHGQHRLGHPQHLQPHAVAASARPRPVSTPSSNGRAILGLGASGPQVIEGFHGIPYDQPLARTREIIEICRMMWKREKLEHTGIYNLPLPEGQGTGLGKALKLINHPVRQHIPIYVAAIGDKNVAMTAEIADGWLPIFFMPGEGAPRVGRRAQGRLGQARRRRCPNSTSWPAACSPSATASKASATSCARSSRSTSGAWAPGARTSTTQLACRYGFEKEAKEIQDLYLDGKKKEAAEVVPAEMLEAMTLVGPEGYVKEKIAAFKESGVTNLQVTAVVADPITDLEKLKAWAS